MEENRGEGRQLEDIISLFLVSLISGVRVASRLCRPVNNPPPLSSTWNTILQSTSSNSAFITSLSMQSRHLMRGLPLFICPLYW